MKLLNAQALHAMQSKVLKDDSELEASIQKIGLVIPDDFILPDLDYIRSKLATTSREEDVDDKVYDFAKFVYKDKGIAGTIPAGFNETLSLSRARE